jgi:CHAT domain-containing protein
MATYRPSANPGQREGILREVQSLVARDEEIEARILESTAFQEPGSRPLASLDDLKKDFLPADCAILEYHMGEQSSGLWLITRSQTRVFQLASRDQIERSIDVAVDLFGGYVERKSDRKKQDKFDSAMRRLSAILLGPLRGIELPQRFLLVLDDDLHRLPFAALRLPDGQYLGLTHDLVRVPSAAYLVQGRKVSRQENFPKAFLAFCDPVFSSNDRRLSDAARSEGTIGLHLSRVFFKDELTTVSSFVPAARRTFRCSFDANVDAVQKMPLDEYAIIHFSTHAIVDDRIPGLSRIVLSSVDRRGRAREGVLFSHQLAELHLRGSLVVLSACDTALGQKVVGEGLLGFVSSLFSAGASQLVLTLTEVDAKGASVFLSRMYRHLLGGTSTTAEHSIMLANRDLVRSKAKRWADPYYWASFVIVGKPAHADETAGNR